MKIYTKTGDKGETSLFGGQRITKSHPRIEAYGSIDELNAQCGVVHAQLRELCADVEARQQPEQIEAYQRVMEEFEAIQHTLFVVGSHLSTPYDPANIPGTLPTFETEAITLLEGWIDAKDAELPKLKNFILPSGTVVGATIHVARTVCRRAERASIRLASEEMIMEDLVRYLNRLSDYLFVAARYVNHVAGVTETPWLTNTPASAQRTKTTKPGQEE